LPQLLAYFGLPLGALTLLAQGHELAFAVLSPVPAAGRRRLLRHLGANRVVEVAEGFEAKVEACFSAQEVELLVSWFYTRQLSAVWLSKARLGGLGVHPSLLPRHRGPNPYFWAIDQGDEFTGVTAHKLTPEYDRGAILLQERLLTGARDAWQLARALDRPSLRLLLKATQGLLAGTLGEVEQDETLATWAHEPDGPELRVDFRWPTERVLRRIRALAPVPGVALEVGGRAFFLCKAERAGSPPLPLEPGELVRWAERAVMATGDGAIALERAVVAQGSSEVGQGVSVGETLAGARLADWLLGA
jgi:methionyl-tRNA formyltransferase